MSIDALRAAGRREIERAAERAVGKRQPAGKAARIGAQVAAGVSPAGVERGDGDDRRGVVRQQDPPVLVKGPSLEPPLAR